MHFLILQQRGEITTPPPFHPRAPASELCVPTVYQAAQRHYQLLRRWSMFNNSPSNSADMVMKKSGYVTSYFANRQFHGGIDHSITHKICNYIHCAGQYELDENLLASCFINNLSEPSPTFFLNNYRPGMIFLEMENFMKAEFSSLFRQNQVRNRLTR